MVAAWPLAAEPPMDAEQDQHVVLGMMSWQAYEAMLAIRGDRAGVRMYYLDGAIEIMSPAKIHESRKKCLARLLELWALKTGVSLNGFGSWTLKKPRRKAGAEPDECYIVGDSTEKEVPDLVIEVESSRELGLPKEEIYRRLGVRELWTLKADGTLVVRALVKGRWALRSRRKLLPKLDLAKLLEFSAIEPQSEAVRRFRDSLRKPKRR
jgi:Uma2 family endonuclease